MSPSTSNAAAASPSQDAGYADRGQPAVAVRRSPFSWLWKGLSFWTVVPFIGILGFIYLFMFADSLYNSNAIVTLQNSSAGSSLSSLVGGSLLGGGGGNSTNESGALIAYIQSHEMLEILDKKFQLRQEYSAPGRNPFWQLSKDASETDFLTFYQGMVTVTQDQTTGLITIDVMDYDAQRSQEMVKTIQRESEKFINSMSAQMVSATIKDAQQELESAEKAVETAQEYQRAVAEVELTAAQQGMAAAISIASQQQVFLIPVSTPTVPTDTAYPDRLVDEAAVLLAACVFYMIGFLMLSNIRDQRPV